MNSMSLTIGLRLTRGSSSADEQRRIGSFGRSARSRPTESTYRAKKKKPTGCIPWVSGGRNLPSRDGVVGSVALQWEATTPARKSIGANRYMFSDCARNLCFYPHGFGCDYFEA